MTTRISITPRTSEYDNATSPYLPIKIDLNNFEDPQFEDSKYVLSSPRSLEACSRLSVKPVDLLYKPLAEFQEELLPQDVPLRTIYNIYDEHEQARVRKLQLCREERYRIIATEPDYNTHGTHRNTVRVNADAGFDKGSLQRQRTAWATSVGHKRLTTKDVQNRAEELHHESLKLKQELLSRKEGRASKSKAVRNRSASRNSSAARNNLATRNSSATRNTSAASISRSSRNNTPARSNTSTRSTRSKINTIQSPVKIPETDKRIVELMKKKRITERKLYAQREKARLAWDDERREELQIRDSAETRRRLLVAEENRIRHMKKQAAEKRRWKSEEELRQGKEVSALETSRQWEESLNKQLHMREQQLLEKQEREQLKKSMQELSLKQRAAERESEEQLVQQRLEAEVRMAEQRKEMRAHAEKMKKMLENQNEREIFEKNRQQVERLNREKSNHLCTSVDLKHVSARSNFEKMLQQKYLQMMLNQSKREKRQDFARQSVEKMDNEMEAWRQDLMHRRKQLERKASESVERRRQETSHRLQEERKARDKEHRVNIKKVHRELAKWERGLRSEIELKDKKSQMLQEERDANIFQTRAVAEATQKLRDEVRHKYDNETIGQKALQAELYSKIGSGVVSAVKNSSSLRFG